MPQAKEYISYFVQKVKDYEKNRFNQFGTNPNHPMLIVYIGNGSLKHHSQLSKSLFETWPVFRDYLRFVSVDIENDNLSLYEIPSNFSNENTIKKSITGEEINMLVGSLYGPDVPFLDRRTFILYYVFDSEDFTNKDELFHQISLISQINCMLNLPRFNKKTMLAIFLNESYGKDTASIRVGLNELSQKKYDEVHIDSILLLSNKYHDFSIDNSWSNTEELFSSVIVLSNNSDPYIIDSFFHPTINGTCRMFTAGRKKFEKPYQQIGNVIVDNIFKEIMNYYQNLEINHQTTDNLKESLGITDIGTFSWLDTIANEQIIPRLPTQRELYLFPRADCLTGTDFSNISLSEFNEKTMGSWNVFINGLIEEILKEEIGFDLVQSLFSTHLLEHVSPDERITLLNSYNDVIQLYNSERSRLRSPDNKPVLDAAVIHLKQMLFSNEKIIDILKYTVEQCGIDAVKYKEKRTEFLDSIVYLNEFVEETIRKYYNSIYTNKYEYQNIEFFRKSLAMINSIEDLDKLIKNTIDQIIACDDSFSDPLLEELQTRLKSLDKDFDLANYVMKQVTGDRLICFYSAHGIQNPYFEAVLMNTGSPAYGFLSQQLNSDGKSFNFYNTGRNQSIESVSIYPLSDGNILF